MDPDGKSFSEALMERSSLIVIIGCTIFLALIFAPQIQASNFPPTRAFSNFFMNGQNVQSDSYAGNLTLIEGSGISLTPNNIAKSITITATGGAGFNPNVTNIGGGSEVYKNHTASDWYFRTLKGGTGTTITQFADFIEITAGSAGLTSINADTTAAQLLTGTIGNITITDLGGGTHNINLGGNVITLDGGCTLGQFLQRGPVNWDCRTITNATTSLKVDNQTVNRKQFAVGLNNATGDWTMQTFALNNQTIQTGDYFVNGIDNQTGVITTKQFSVNTQTTTCSGSDKVSAVSINNATGAVTITCSTVTASGGAISLGANVTVTGSVSGDTLIWTIPLTANSGNTVDGVMTGTSSVSGTAIRGAANLTNVSSRGFCMWTQVSTTTANAIDNLVLNTVLTGRATNTGETAWIAAANTAEPILFTCSIKTGATPGDLKIWATPEATGATQQIKAGSYYIKTP